MRLWQWLMGTVRPISFLAWIPVLGGAYFGGTIDLGTSQAAIGAILVSSLANSLNNFLDRQVDRAAGKTTVAVNNPQAGYTVVIWLLALVAQNLLSRGYNQELLALILAVSCLYSFVPNHLQIIKRFVVAGAVTATSFLDVEIVNLAVILWAVGIFAIITYRETVKDRSDWLTDLPNKFVAWREILADTWCLTAPILGSGLFLTSCCLVDETLGLRQWLGAIITGFAVIGYLHIRAKHGRYHYHFHQGTTAEGRLALICSLTSAVPMALNPAAALLLIWNMASIWLRSHQRAHIFDTLAGRLHDAQLWASIPLLAMVLTDGNLLILFSLAGTIFAITLIIQLSWRQLG